MSRKRNRHRSLSNTSRESQRSKTASGKRDFIGRSTAHSMFVPHDPQDSSINMELINQEKLYNRNISFFRDNFNQNDRSQLPFMSSLRQKKQFNPATSKTITVCFPYEAALKNTSNQLIKKRISDFASKQNRLSVASYRWHNRSGKNNKWGVQFQCSLRDYGKGAETAREKEFYPYVSPVFYQDVEPLEYNKSDMICPRHNRSFVVR